MKASRAFLLILSYGLNEISAQDPLQGIFRQSGPCFPTKRSPATCNRSLAESFTPKSPNVVNDEPRTLVYLFTPTSPDVAEALHECGGKLSPCSTYDPNANTEIFIHGWLDGVCRTAWMRESKDQLFLRAQRLATLYNVILVDWTWGNTPDYYVASQNCKIVGEQVGYVITNIMTQKGVGPEKFHVVGHSFGAISAGFAGRKVPGLRRITALDPSSTPFRTELPDQKVTYRDAQIVDVIHANSIDCFPLGNSETRSLGDADFYPNGGAIQTSCIPYILTSFVKGDILYALASLLLPPICSHLQAIQYYKVSINPQGCEFVGLSAESYEEFLTQPSEGREWAVMGMDYELFHKNDGERRKFYLTTTNKCPYTDDSYLTNRTYPFKTTCSSNTFIQPKKLLNTVDDTFKQPKKLLNNVDDTFKQPKKLLRNIVDVV